MKSRVVDACFGMLLSLLPSAAFAQCAGFVDVSAGHPLCGNVTWLKNRGVTLGCGSGTTFCPDAAVTRVQMAAFMNRTGNVLAPRVEWVEQAGNALMLDSEKHVCQTPDFPGADYQRDVHADGSLSWDATAGGQLLVSVVQSLDSGITWDSVPLNDQPVVAATRPGARRHASVTLRREPLAVSNTSSVIVRFALRVQGVPASGQLTTFACNLQVVVSSARE